MDSTTLFDAVAQSEASADARVFLAVGGVPTARTSERVSMHAFQTFRIEEPEDMAVLGQQIGRLVKQWIEKDQDEMAALFLQGFFTELPELAPGASSASASDGPTLAERVTTDADVSGASQFLVITATPEHPTRNGAVLVQLERSHAGDTLELMGRGLGQWMRAYGPSLRQRFEAGLQAGYEA